MRIETRREATAGLNRTERRDYRVPTRFVQKYTVRARLELPSGAHEAGFRPPGASRGSTPRTLAWQGPRGLLSEIKVVATERREFADAQAGRRAGRTLISSSRIAMRNTRNARHVPCC